MFLLVLAGTLSEASILKNLAMDPGLSVSAMMPLRSYEIDYP
jgi:hypothetical protein